MYNVARAMRHLRWIVAAATLVIVAGLVYLGLARSPQQVRAGAPSPQGDSLAPGQAPPREECLDRVNVFLDAGEAEPVVAGAMVTVPGGVFLMGSRPEEGAPDEHPARCVTVAPFRISVGEVSVGEFREFWNDGHPSFEPRDPVVYPGGLLRWPDGERPREPLAESPEHPECTWEPTSGNDASRALNCVDWVTAQAFCVERGARLPTEAEWEFVARGDSRRRFPWGDQPPAIGLVNACDRRCAAAHPWLAPMFPNDEDDPSVGSGFRYPAAAALFSVTNLAGNVSEWTADPYGREPTRLRAVRGGNWADHDPARLRSAARQGVDRGATLDTLGFRCVRSVE